MAKGKKPKHQQGSGPQIAAAPHRRDAATAAQATTTESKRVPDGSATARWSVAEFWRHPTLLLASISWALALLSAWAVVHFRDNMEMGAVREPTGIILWAAIALTLLASYRRGRNRAKPHS